MQTCCHGLPMRQITEIKEEIGGYFAGASYSRVNARFPILLHARCATFQFRELPGVYYKNNELIARTSGCHTKRSLTSQVSCILDVFVCCIYGLVLGIGGFKAPLSGCNPRFHRLSTSGTWGTSSNCCCSRYPARLFGLLTDRGGSNHRLSRPGTRSVGQVD